MNALIRLAADAGMSQTVYVAFLVASFIGMAVFTVFHGTHYGIPKHKSAILTAVLWPVGYFLLYVLYWVESGFSRWGEHNNIVRGFIYFPLIVLALSAVLRIDKRKAVDMTAPGMALVQGIAHIGCCFAGCCNGYPADFGLWNPDVGCYMFPNQPLESLAAFLTFAVCVIYAKKHHYDGNGKVYPLFLILFGVTRFFLEFLRDNEKIGFNLSASSIHAAIMVVVGAIWIFIIYAKAKKSCKGDRQ